MRLAPIAGKLPRNAFVSVLVVAGEPGHGLLPRREVTFRLGQEAGGRPPAQGSCDVSSMADFDLAALSDAVGEPEIRVFCILRCAGRWFHAAL